LGSKDSLGANVATTSISISTYGEDLDTVGKVHSIVGPFGGYVEVPIDNVEEAGLGQIFEAASSQAAGPLLGPDVVRTDAEFQGPSGGHVSPLELHSEEPTCLQETVHVRNLGAEEEARALGRMKIFCSKLLKTLAPPLLKEVDSTAALRAEVGPFTPRRSVRFAGPVSGQKPPRKASAEEAALLKALGVVPGELTICEDAVQELRQFFDSPVREHHFRVLTAIFGKTMPPRHELFGGGNQEVGVQA
jgi:hypothetical protein